jgi:adenylate kinase
MFVVFIGPPGAGKGTQSQLLVDYLQIPHLSTGDLLRLACQQQTEVGKQAQAYMDAGQLVPDPIMVQIVKHRLEQPDCAQGCLFDGFPRTIVQAESLDRILNQRQTPLDIVLELRVDEAVLVKRLAGRGRTDDRPEIVRQRLKAFYDRIKALLEYYESRGLLHTIDGLGPMEEVFDRIKNALAARQAR